MTKLGFWDPPELLLHFSIASESQNLHSPTTGESQEQSKLVTELSEAIAVLGGRSNRVTEVSESVLARSQAPPATAAYSDQGGQASKLETKKATVDARTSSKFSLKEEVCRFKLAAMDIQNKDLEKLGITSPDEATPKSMPGQSNGKKSSLDGRSETSTERKMKEGKTSWGNGRNIHNGAVDVYSAGLLLAYIIIGQDFLSFEDKFNESRFGCNKLDASFRDEIINYVLGRVCIASKDGTGIRICDEYSRVMDIFRDYDGAYERLEQLCISVDNAIGIEESNELYYVQDGRAGDWLPCDTKTFKSLTLPLIRRMLDVTPGFRPSIAYLAKTLSITDAKVSTYINHSAFDAVDFFISTSLSEAQENASRIPETLIRSIKEASSTFGFTGSSNLLLSYIAESLPLSHRSAKQSSTAWNILVRAIGADNGNSKLMLRHFFRELAKQEMSIPPSIGLPRTLELALEVLLFQFSEPTDNVGLRLKRDATELLM
ncbi:hypothetical protein BGZ57DRAFT_800846, partial [Hyaloscypha finlandica]